MNTKDRDRFIKDITMELKTLRGVPITKLPASAKDNLILARNFLRAVNKQED